MGGDEETKHCRDGYPFPQNSERKSGGLLNRGSNSSSRKKAKTSEISVTLRRSARLQCPVIKTNQNTDIEPVIQEVSFTASDKEDEPLTREDDGEVERLGNENGQYEPLINANVEGEKLEQITGSKTTEEKLDCLLEHLVSKIESLKEENRQLSVNSEKMVKDLEEENRQSTLKLEKMVESLKEENRQLSLKLEYAFGKLDAYDKAYEKVSGFCSDVLGKVKDVVSAFHVGDTSRDTSPYLKEKESPLKIRNISPQRKRLRKGKIKQAG